MAVWLHVMTEVRIGLYWSKAMTDSGIGFHQDGLPMTKSAKGSELQVCALWFGLFNPTLRTKGARLR
jgi:hypothetical protein